MVDKILKIKFCDASFLFNTLQNSPDKCLVLDTRSKGDYDSKSLNSSLNLNRDMIENSLTSASDQTYSETPTGDVITRTTLTMSNIQSTMNQDWKRKLQFIKRCFCVLIINNQDYLSQYLKEEIQNSELLLLDHFEKELPNPKDALNGVSVENNDEITSIEFGLELYELFNTEKVRELYIMVDGADKFFTTYPFLEKKAPSVNMEKGKTVGKYPNEILRQRLYLGNKIHASSEEIMSELKITHVVNCAIELENYFEDRAIKYLNVSVRDDDDTSIGIHFKKANEFIENALNENADNRVFIHCHLGKSRSATITIMFLMNKFSWNCDKAYEYVKSKRNLVNPNPGFISQLENFQKNFEFEKNSTECNIEELSNLMSASLQVIDNAIASS